MTGDQRHIFPILSGITLAMLAFASFVPFHETLNRVSLYAVMPTMVILCFVQRETLLPNRWWGILMLLYGWLCLTYFGAYFPDVALNELHMILGCILLSYVFAIMGQEKVRIPWLYGCFVLLFIAASIYAFTHIIPYIELGQERLTDDNLNANTLAYYTFFLLFAIYQLGDICPSKILQKLFKVAFILLLPIIYLVAMITASRQVPILQLPLYALLFFIRYFRSQTVKPLYKILIIASCIVAATFFVPDIAEDIQESRLGERVQTNVYEDGRVVLLKEAIAIGKEHFLTGVGPGNFRMFSSAELISHNTFAELWANTGFLGMLIYVFLLTAVILSQWKRYRETRAEGYLVFLLFFIFYTLYQFFYVFYFDLWMMSSFILVATHSDTIYSTTHKEQAS